MAQSDTRPRRIGWFEALNARYWRAPTVIVLIIANLVPLYGVLVLKWDLFTLMVAYWMETGVIGFYTALRMMIVGRLAALFMVPFFIIHFGGFMAGHFLFLWTMFAAGPIRDAPDPFEMARRILIDSGLWIALLAMFISHGVSFVLNFLLPRLRGSVSPWEAKTGKVQSEREELGAIMGTPYGRVVVMHLTILFGAALVQLFDTKAAAFILLIVLKTAVDMAAHVRKNFAPQPS